MHVTAIPAATAADRRSGVITVAFGIAVAMWALGYFSRLPGLQLPSPLLLTGLLLCMFAGGWLLGRSANLGAAHGAMAGAIAGLLNLLVLGSLLSGDRPNEVAPSALIWLPGSILLAALLVAAGASAGARGFRRSAPYREWSFALARVAIGACLLLLAVGGLVTSTGAGLAVVDWPNSFGYNMFLFPLSRMTGGIYYEHAHRLFGALVGLTTFVLAWQLQLRDPRRWVRRLGWLAAVMVLVQGTLGGLRVTGGFTLSTSAEAMRPNLALAMIHGILGQLFFGTLVALGAFTSPTWTGGAAALRRPGVGWDRLLAVFLVGLLTLQLVLGAAQRHFSQLLFVHIAVGVAIVTPLALRVGFRAWGLNEGQRLLQRLGLALIAGIGLQILLGLSAYVSSVTAERAGEPLVVEVLLTTVHQWFGAVLLALAVAALCWYFRLLKPDRSGGS